jgi:hypothetical protein
MGSAIGMIPASRQIESYGSIQRLRHRFTEEQDATALSIISEIAPKRESQWLARLNFTYAPSAWDELTRAYAPRAELE